MEHLASIQEQIEAVAEAVYLGTLEVVETENGFEIRDHYGPITEVESRQEAEEIIRVAKF